MAIDFSLNGMQSLLFSLAILLAPVPHFWSLLAFFLVYYWILAWVKKNTTSSAIRIEDQIKKGQLFGRLTPNIAHGILTRYGGRLLWIKLGDTPTGPYLHIT
ncbi:hypothetical protein B0H14DRAFT_3450913 [Mycena olivaceomarginata]|nr:hypothetical protein B0H14DRAFT_3450913 [Mycena olivaceomarginata]